VRRDARLSHTLERGSGCAATLAIIHMELCRRLGLPLAAAILVRGPVACEGQDEGGLWPALKRRLQEAPHESCAHRARHRREQADGSLRPAGHCEAGAGVRPAGVGCIGRAPPWPRARARQDKERYFVLWPEAAPLAALGEHVVLDPYSGGAPAMLSEVRT